MTDPEAKNIILDLFREKLKLTKLFRWNASMKHGIPIESETPSTITVNHIIPEKSQPSVDNKLIDDLKKRVESISTNKTEQTMPTWAKWLGAGLLTSVLGLGGATSYLFMNQPDETSVVQPNQPRSALQWLEDEGEHLP